MIYQQRHFAGQIWRLPYEATLLLLHSSAIRRISSCIPCGGLLRVFSDAIAVGIAIGKAAHGSGVSVVSGILIYVSRRVLVQAYSFGHILLYAMSLCTASCKLELSFRVIILRSLTVQIRSRFPVLLHAVSGSITVGKTALCFREKHFRRNPRFCCTT